MAFHKILNGIHFYLSDRKKYKALVPGTNRYIHFGARGYQQYHDRIGYYSHLNREDKKRLDLYRKRHRAILDNDGTPSYKKKYSPAWFSWHYLW